ncbi:protein SUPPRESSOR OF npr1-1, CONSTITUTIVE 1-like [Pistacia vera]|uniref:protein SUPPRESSOR OF npr1-1, CONSTITUTIVE 1-like n=1 Tax=Pistacia vera TaxID=55513 RepID=UPI0012639913|nr:protein SUPPRESSOR OF npr1-1, CONSTITUTIVE 1-like [Pistacia vera]
MASSSSSSSRVSQKYHVFLSFRGEDTRDNFTSHLHAALCSKKINTFIDDELHRGDEISEALLNAIKESMIAVIIFSKGYATSRWCLEELAKIIECKKARDLMVVPVFYHVDSSDVRNQTGTFGEAFANHEEKQTSEKVMRWRNALKEAANLSGFDSSNIRREAVLIGEIVKNILEELNKMSPSENKDLIGIESKIEKLESLLCLELKDVCRSVGIWGMGGIGKTALACALFTKISSQFESVHFQNVGEKSEKCLGEELLSAILEDRWAVLESTFTKSRFHNKKVLIVFDDVTCSEQIEKLIRDLECLGPGSRVIITGRDKQVLKTCGVNHGDIYKVEGLPSNESLILFSRHAFKLDHPPIDYLELSIRVIKFAQGVPLALKVLGSSLFEKEKSLWESTLINLEKNPNPKIQEVLEISYNGLDDQEKNIFLDIICFLIGAERNIATEFLDGDDFDSDMGVSNLIDKSLITLDDIDSIEVHDLLQKMGKKIVKQESKDPSKRSRLWHHDDIYKVLRSNTGSETIESISLDISKIKELNLKCNVFLKMQNLRFLDFYCRSKVTRRGIWNGYNCRWYFHCFCFELREDQDRDNCVYCSMDEKDVNKVHALHGLEFSSCNIRLFSWFGYPLDTLPSNFEVENLSRLIMPCSKIKQLWNGLQHLEKLKYINLIHCKYLIRIPDLSSAPNLESLILEGCTSLIEVHSSIQYLNKLVILNLKGCKSLNSLPANIQSKFLEYLILSGCSNLKKAPKITCNVEQLYFDGTSITELPFIEYPSKLDRLDLKDCSRLESLQQLGKLKKLHNLSLSGYRGQDLMVDSVWSLLSNLSLYILDLSDCQIMTLPSILGEFKSLYSLNLSRNTFESIPSSFKKLKLKYLDISYCERLKCLPLGAETVEAYNCMSLEFCDLDLFSSVKKANYGNCLKLYQNMLKANWGEIAGRILFHGPLLCPGNEIPEWFSFQSVGSSITLEVLPVPHDIVFTSLKVCLVVTPQDHDEAPPCLFICSKVIGIDENGQRQEIEELTKALAKWGYFLKVECNSPMSDHVMVWTAVPSIQVKKISRYLTFEFSGIYHNVVKCGLRTCIASLGKQYKGDFSSNMEEEPQAKRLKF